MLIKPVDFYARREAAMLIEFKSLNERYKKAMSLHIPNGMYSDK